MPRTAKSICSVECGGRCCKLSFIELTPEEADWLPRLAAEHNLPLPRIEPRDDGGTFVMHATPCIFLNKANLCSIHRNRPGRCRAFPDTLREWCPLSATLFPDLLPPDFRPASARRRVAGRPRQPRQRIRDVDT